ncbi:MAG: NAD-dependent deacylase [Desulfobacterales bacterium]|nr:MAG: NAD-dependent deacylase [Desulfobacterales bacterium]
MQAEVRKAAGMICQARKTVALTGAGISVESGIPDFRSAGGLWERFDPMEYGTIDAFRVNPEKVWRMLREMSAVISRARPNAGHDGLTRLQRMGLLHTIITQNIDSLHQEAGAVRVIEYHGNSRTLSCLWCGQQYRADELDGEQPPKCACGRILKPDVIFFGETIPEEPLRESYKLASSCQILLVVGTSAEVIPASTIPYAAKMAKAKIIEINVKPTWLTASLTDIFLEGEAGKVVTGLVHEVKRLMR